LDTEEEQGGHDLFDDEGQPILERHYQLSDLISRRMGIKKFNLDELYVRFFRLAERRIAEKTGKVSITLY